MCGEKISTLPMRRGRLGSPPRVRGKAFSMISPISRARITPACAGKSILQLGNNFRRWDHPRVCGEKRELDEIAEKGEGSPPRVRGKGLNWPQITPEVRITPACAGKSVSWRHGDRFRRDHPRVCGEKFQLFVIYNICGGSPPRVRGKVLCRAGCPAHCGITPACAGKSAYLLALRKEAEDHPRVCGEKASVKSVVVPSSGSPPRVRGKD